MIRLLFIYILCMVSGLSAAAQETIELTGEWAYSVGDSTQYNDYVTLPGTVPANEKVWLSKSVYVPQTWEKKHVTLFLERPLGETTLFVNGQEAGRQTSLIIPHQYDISDYLVPGQRNKIAICVNKGIVGLMGLKTQSKKLYIDKWTMRPDIQMGLVHQTFNIGGTKRLIGGDVLYGDVWQIGHEDKQPIEWGNYLEDRQMSITAFLGNETYLWDEFRPRLYGICATLGNEYQEKKFGIRMFSVNSGQLCINGCPIWLNGMVEDGSRFSETGYPPMDEDTWTDIFKKCEEYGLNYMRFRGYCPPEAAFAAADKIGFYLQTDSCGETELQQMMETYGHHPSLMMLTPYSAVTQRIQELGPWPAFPDTKEVRDKLRDNGMAYQAELFMMASGKQQTLRYKDEIEQNLRDKDKAGFLMPSFSPYAKAEEWREFCSPVVALAQFPKYVYANTDSLIVPVGIYNAMYGEIQNTRTAFYISDDSMKVKTGGILSVGKIPVAKNVAAGTVCFPLDSIKKPERLSLVVTVAGKLKNKWDFWVYPTDSVETVDVPQDICITDTLNAKALDVLKNGGKVLLTARGKVQYNGREALGTYIEQSHPLFKYDFPTDMWANRNWQELLDGSLAMDLTALPKDYLSPIQPIDQPETCRKLGMLVEANVLKGKLLVTTMDIANGLDRRLVARQMRKAILSYMQGDDFKPVITLQPQTVSSLITK
ncbi:MAG: hypothetical protein J5658_10250 [Prevotella sp.]|nr:hypothetical protein [Prevotella sp.]